MSGMNHEPFAVLMLAHSIMPQTGERRTQRRHQLTMALMLVSDLCSLQGTSLNI